MPESVFPKSPGLTRDQWVVALEDYLEAQHCSLFGQAFASGRPEERQKCAEWFADVIMEAGSHAHC